MVGSRRGTCTVHDRCAALALAANQQLGHFPLLLAADVEDFVRAFLLQAKPGNFPTPETGTRHHFSHFAGQQPDFVAHGGRQELARHSRQGLFHFFFDVLLKCTIGQSEKEKNPAKTLNTLIFIVWLATLLSHSVTI
jgi:hypothetical protein